MNGEERKTRKEEARRKENERRWSEDMQCRAEDMKRARGELGGTCISKVILLKEKTTKSKESIEGDGTKSGR